MDTDLWRYCATACVIGLVLFGVGLALHVADVIDIACFTFAFWLIVLATYSFSIVRDLHNKLGLTLTVLIAASILLLGLGVILFLIFVLRIWPTPSTF